MTIYTIEDMKKIASQKGGHCLSNEYINMKTALLWKCGQGHVFKKTFDSIKNKNSWCTSCTKVKVAKKRRKYTLEQMKKFASQKGGECLSTEFKNTNNKLRWNCRNGHIWEASYETVKKHWCGRCAGNTKKTMEDIYKIANKLNLECLSTKYVNAKEKMIWKCYKGHVFYKMLDHLQRGSGCPDCYEEVRGEKRRVYTIEDACREAEKVGGNCLSREYKNYNDKLEWECVNGHKFDMKFGHVKDGHWCRICGYEKIAKSRRSYTIEDMREIASKYGGECLSIKYHSINKKLKWKCSNGHEFEKSYGHISRGQWCSVCSLGLNESKCRYILENLFKSSFPKTRKELISGLELDGYNSSLKLAFEYQGEQHYQFIKPFHRSKEDFLNQLKRDAAKRKECKELGIHLLEVPYWLDDEGKINFIIEELTRFGLSSKINVKHMKRKMKNFYKTSNQLNELQEIAEQRGGKLLSDTYMSCQTKMLWRCKEGHKFWKVPSQVKQGQWCKICGLVSMAKKITIHTIEEMQEIAKKYGGKCLSEEYFNSRTKLIWKCNKGHVFKKNQENIKAGQWCPECKKENIKENNRRKGLEKCIQLAKEREGELLSAKYTLSTSKLCWICKEGHTFEYSRTEVQTGKWCKKCKLREKGFYIRN